MFILMSTVVISLRPGKHPREREKEVKRSICKLTEVILTELAYLAAATMLPSFCVAMAPEKLRKMEQEEAAVSATEYKKHSKTEPAGWGEIRCFKDALLTLFAIFCFAWLEIYHWSYYFSKLGVQSFYTLSLPWFSQSKTSTNSCIFLSYSALSPSIQPDGFMK